MLKSTIHMEQKGRTDIMIKRLLELQSFSTNKVFNELAACRRRTVSTDKLPLVVLATSEPSVPKELPVFRPVDSDTLFWCFYLMRYGEEEYFYHQQGLYAESGRRKAELVQELRMNKSTLKAYKVKLTDVEWELVTPHITRRAFIGLCAMSSLPVIFVQGRTFLRIGGDSSNKWNVIRNDKQGWYLQQDVASSDIDGMCEALYEVVDMEKPIKSCSGYTLSQLKDIAAKLGVSPYFVGEKKLTKLDWYQEILAKL